MIKKVDAMLVCQVWDGDYLYSGEESSFDIQPVLDSYPVSDLPSTEDDLERCLDDGTLDFLAEEAIAAGVISWSGPYELRIDTDEYIRYIGDRIANQKNDGRYRRLALDKISNIIDVSKLTYLLDTTRCEVNEDEMRDMIVCQLSYALSKFEKRSY